MSHKPPLIGFALRRPRLVAWLVALITLALLLAAVLPTLLPGSLGALATIEVDTDPENMLAADEPVRVFHNQAKQMFNLHDGVVVGVVNETHEQGVFNQQTLSRVHALATAGSQMEGVIRADVLALSTVDSITHTGPGSVSFNWLMARPPADDAEALVVRELAMRIPFLRGTLVAEDGRALAIYLPLAEKNQAHEIALQLRQVINSFPSSDDDFHIAGLPVAEDTFGIEMFKQMAISAPVAMLVIFLLMWAFFRRLVVIVSPMLVAMAASLSTMALLVITGHTIHIMSSMIPIFIMPIAVLDAVHIISDFFERYPGSDDRKQVITSVMSHLFTPMLYTSLTTAAGFASLALTPIPPVQVFGVFVAIGVLLAWLCTITLVPAYLVLLSDAALADFGNREPVDDAQTRGDDWLVRVGRFSRRRAWLIALITVALGVFAGWGISRIRINDNPTKWFEPDHRIRVADRVMNRHFGGIYDAFLQLSYQAPPYTPERYAERLRADARAATTETAALFNQVATWLQDSPAEDVFGLLDAVDANVRAQAKTGGSEHRRVALAGVSTFLNERYAAAEERADADPTGTPDTGTPAGAPVTTNAPQPGDTGASIPAGDAAQVAVLATAPPLTPLARERAQLVADVRAQAEAVGAWFAALDAMAAQVARLAPADPAAFTAALERAIAEKWPAGPAHDALVAYIGALEQSQQVFKDPRLLRYLARLQDHLQKSEVVGKSSSLADVVKTVHRDLVSGEDADYRLPDDRNVVAETLIQYQSSHRKDDLWHFVTPDYQNAVIWVQLTRGDNLDMQSVVDELARFTAAHPPPIELMPPSWFGLTYINVIWQDKMVSGMLRAFLGSFVVVMLMMMVLFRSFIWGFLSMIPLTVTVAVIYGLIGAIGKDYDMPVAVLSSLSLGLAIDYAIHFLARARALHRSHGSWPRALDATFGEPARAIARNVVVVGVGFLPLLLAPLVPYQTVGTLIAAILLAAGAASLVLLPALLTLLRRWMLPTIEAPEKAPSRSATDDPDVVD